MTEIQKYLAEEVAEDLADGIITRREAMRRLGLLGVSGAAASALLAAGGVVPAVARHNWGSTETAWAPVPRESITFAGPRVPLMAAWAPAAKARGGVLVIHENRGLNEHIRLVAGRFAASGWSALATRSIRIARSTLDDRAGVIGAAVMVIEAVLDPDAVDQAIAAAG